MFETQLFTFSRTELAISRIIRCYKSQEFYCLTKNSKLCLTP